MSVADGSGSHASRSASAAALPASLPHAPLAAPPLGSLPLATPIAGGPPHAVSYARHFAASDRPTLLFAIDALAEQLRAALDKVRRVAADCVDPLVRHAQGLEVALADAQQRNARLTKELEAARRERDEWRAAASAQPVATNGELYRATMEAVEELRRSVTLPAPVQTPVKGSDAAR